MTASQYIITGIYAPLFRHRDSTAILSPQKKQGFIIDGLVKSQFWSFVSFPHGDCVAIDFCPCEREIVGHVTPRGETNIAGSGHVPFRVDPAYIAFPTLDITTQSHCHADELPSLIGLTLIRNH